MLKQSKLFLGLTVYL